MMDEITAQVNLGSVLSLNLYYRAWLFAFTDFLLLSWLLHYIIVSSVSIKDAIIYELKILTVFWPG